jgi:hypothetical protein
MLRTTDEDDAIATLRFWATGTMTVDGRPCRLATYAASVWLGQKEHVEALDDEHLELLVRYRLAFDAECCRTVN